MAGRKPTPVLLSLDDDEHPRTIKLVSVQNLYIVLYENKPFILRYDYPKQTTSSLIRNMVFVNFGHCARFVEKMNRLTNSEDFTMKQIYSIE